MQASCSSSPSGGALRLNPGCSTLFLTHAIHPTPAKPRGRPEQAGLSMIRLLSVVGARPNFMKIAPILEALKKDEIEHDEIKHDEVNQAKLQPNSLKQFHHIEHCLVHSGQ